VLATLLLALPGPAAAQAPQTTLTLDRAVGETLARNHALQAARAGADQAAAHADAAQSAWYPRLSVAESWQRGNQPVFVFGTLLSSRQFAAQNFLIDSLNHPDPIGSFKTTIAVEQLIYDGGRQSATTEGADLQRDIAGLAVNEVSADLAVAATTAFGRLLAAQAARNAAEAGLASSREDRARAGRRRDAGMATDADVLALAVHVADLEQRLIQAAGDAAVARAELNRLRGAPIDEVYEALEPPTLAAIAPPEPLEALLAEADVARPEIQRARAATSLAETGRRQARSALIPQVAAQAAFDVTGTSFADRASAWIVGGEFRWTFSTGGAELARSRGAAAGESRARAEAEDARARVQVEVVTALRRLEAARARQAVGLAAVNQARETERIIRDRFAAGLVGVGDVLRASSAVLDATSQRTAALVDAIGSDALLRRAVGR
jgi:outer membrane protein TolC